MEARIMGSRNLMQQKKTIKRISLKNANDMRTIIVFLLTLFSVGISNAQHQWKYKPFKDFGQDTLSYLKQNFDSKFNDNYFKGKSVADLLAYIEPHYEKIEYISENESLNVISIQYHKSRTQNSRNIYRFYVIYIFVEPIRCPVQFKVNTLFPEVMAFMEIYKKIKIKNVICAEDKIALILKQNYE